MTIYAIDKKTNTIRYGCSNKHALDLMLEQNHDNIKNYLVLQEFDMKYVSRIAYVDRKCIYNNKEYWTKTALENPITEENFNEHEVLDFMGQPVLYERYIDEFNNNINRLSVLDGLAGEIDYNMTVGNEFIALFREECVKTDFKGITPLEIGMKLEPVISLVQTGSFREAKQVLQTMETDPFLTEERMAKYIAMMDAADAIEYATDEDFYYTADVDEPEEAE